MEIALVTTTYPSATQTFVMDHVEALVERGHDVDVFAFRRGDELHEVSSPTPRRIRYIPPTKGKIEVLVKCARWLTGSIVNGLNPLAALTENWETDNFTDFERPLNRLPYLERFVFPNTYSVVHCHFAKPGALMATLLPFIGQPALVTTVHGYDAFQDNQSHWYTKAVTERTDRFLSHSKNLDERLIELGIPKNKIERHRYGIDVEEFSPPREDSRDRSVHLLSVARLVEKKGLAYAMEGIAQLPDSLRSRLTYKIAGDGPRRQQLEEKISQRGLESTVEVLGFRDRGEIKDLYQWADVFILPSVVASNGDREGTPVSLLEAQASGLPVISTYHSGIPEIVSDGTSGLLVEERNARALRDALKQLIDQPDRRSTMGEAGRAYVLENHDSYKLTSNLLELYENLSRRSS